MFITLTCAGSGWCTSTISNNGHGWTIGWKQFLPCPKFRKKGEFLIMSPFSFQQFSHWSAPNFTSSTLAASRIQQSYRCLYTTLIAILMCQDERWGKFSWVWPLSREWRWLSKTLRSDCQIEGYSLTDNMNRGQNQAYCSPCPLRYP